MDGPSHTGVAAAAFDLPAQRDDTLYYLGWRDQVAADTAAADHDKFLELVRVLRTSRIDPHHSLIPGLVPDQAIREDFGNTFTAFNHFIDIRKGPGKFDDFDGYSYGSASSGQHENLTNETGGKWVGLLDVSYRILTLFTKGGIKVDDAVTWYESDCYVHAPGRKR